jgi:hypothetical protein
MTVPHQSHTGWAKTYDCHRIEGINVISHNLGYRLGLSAIAFRLVKRRLIDDWVLLSIRSE